VTATTSIPSPAAASTAPGTSSPPPGWRVGGGSGTTNGGQRERDERDRREPEEDPRPAERGRDEAAEHGAGQRAGGQKQLRDAGEAGEQRAQRHRGEAGHQRSAVAERVADPPAEQQERPERQGVGGDHPLQTARRQLEIVLDRGQRDGHDRAVERDLAGAEDGERGARAHLATPTQLGIVRPRCPEFGGFRGRGGRPDLLQFAGEILTFRTSSSGFRPGVAGPSTPPEIR
jgi:hypothetical protein